MVVEWLTMQTATVRTLGELGDVAKAVTLSCTPRGGAFVVTLSGELGAGKTAFVKELAKHLGVSHEITSPTFVIMRSYPIPAPAPFTTLTHIDAYRIESDDEMRVLGFDAILRDKNRIVCIEWPEKIANLIPEDAHRVSLTVGEGEARTVTYGT
jgi:tRNA threonylcarbamoyladenosine biosynthesis protein TsaE